MRTAHRRQAKNGYDGTLGANEPYAKRKDGEEGQKQLLEVHEGSEWKRAAAKRSHERHRRQVMKKPGSVLLRAHILRSW